MATPRVCTFISGLVLASLAVGLTASQLPWRPALLTGVELDLLTGAELDLLTQTYSTC